MKRHISKVYFEEIPSFHINDDGEFYVSKGLHINIVYDKDKTHKCYMSDKFRTMYKHYHLNVALFSVYDLLAFHVYNYLHQQCRCFEKQEYKVLWRMLRQSNNLFKAIQKFIVSMLNYYRYQIKSD